jgi:hypothetical protein
MASLQAVSGGLQRLCYNGRLIGIGMRLQIAADALDRWANGEKEAVQ